MEHAEVSRVTFCQNKGWIKSDIFMKLLKHFVKHAKPSKENKVLLIMTDIAVTMIGSFKIFNLL